MTAAVCEARFQLLAVAEGCSWLGKERIVQGVFVLGGINFSILPAKSAEISIAEDICEASQVEWRRCETVRGLLLPLRFRDFVSIMYLLVET